jgi:ABC-type transport system involved in multi-copper enzyme maturation permease subunit
VSPATGGEDARPQAAELALDLRIVAGYALREAVRRKVLVVVVVLTFAFLALYAYGSAQAFKDVSRIHVPVQADIHEQVLTGSTLLGLAMFVTLFLGTVLAVFVTLNAVRGDAERGLLQPLVVRPIGRSTLLLARFLAAAAVCVAYVCAVYAAAVALTGATGGYWPDNPVLGGLSLAAAVVVVVALALLGTTLLSSTANGIAIFMIFGAGLAAGLIGQIGSALHSSALQRISSISSWALPFEAIYQDGLNALTADVRGVTGVLVSLGPFGGAHAAGPLLYPYVLAYLAVVGALADRAFKRADL